MATFGKKRFSPAEKIGIFACHKPQLHPHGASHEHPSPRKNTTPCSHKPQLHPKGASHEHNPAEPFKGQKNMPQLHPNGETANKPRCKKPQLHPTRVSLEHQTGEKRNISQLHPTGVSLEHERGKKQRNNKPQLHPTGASHEQHARVNKDNAAARVDIDKGTPRGSSLRTNDVSHLQRANRRRLILLNKTRSTLDKSKAETKRRDHRQHQRPPLMKVRLGRAATKGK